MMSYLNDRHNVFKKRNYRRQATGGNVLEGGCRDGPCIVFDDAVLPRLVVHEWERHSKGDGLNSRGYNVERGGWITQFRAFAAEMIKVLVAGFQCTIVWVRDGGVNDKPNFIRDVMFEELDWGCAEADEMIECKQAEAIGIRTVDTADNLRPTRICSRRVRC